MPSTVLVTGGAGYLGSVLTGQLLAEGYRVTALDNLAFGNLSAVRPYFAHPGYRFLVGDILSEEVLEQALEGADAVVHLAAVVGDAACAKDPEQAYRVNVTGTQQMVHSCRARGVDRLVLASTCSVYGPGLDDGLVDEETPVNPLSVYASSKVEAERSVLEEEGSGGASFVPTVLRFATLFGRSPRMRFDLMVNTMTACAYLKKKITAAGPHLWRPLLSVRDAARLVEGILKASPGVEDARVLNAGFTSENYQVGTVAELVQQELPDAVIEVVTGYSDARSYRVSFERLARLLPLPPSCPLVEGIREMADAFRRGEFPDWAGYRNA